jgi:DNA-binding MarR family transcriptional regulator
MDTMTYDYYMSQLPPAAPFETATGFLLARLGSLAERSWTEMLGQFKLTAHHHGVLLILRAHSPLGQQELGRMIGVDPRNVVPILDGLVDQGLLDRQTDPIDRRRRILSLTPKGQATADRLATAANAIEEQFLQALDQQDNVELNRILLHLLGSLTN